METFEKLIEKYKPGHIVFIRAVSRNTSLPKDEVNRLCLQHKLLKPLFLLICPCCGCIAEIREDFCFEKEYFCPRNDEEYAFKSEYVEVAYKKVNDESEELNYEIF